MLNKLIYCWFLLPQKAKNGFKASKTQHFLFNKQTI